MLLGEAACADHAGHQRAARNHYDNVIKFAEHIARRVVASGHAGGVISAVEDILCVIVWGWGGGGGGAG